MIKLHLGCGKRDFGTDWIHIDEADFPHIKYKNVLNLEFPNNTVDLIYTSHMLEYFNRDEAKNVLMEWSRVLKPTGVLRIAVPDFEAMAKLYCNEKYTLDKFLGPLFGKMPQNDSVIYHKTTYDFDSLKKILEECGFSSIHRYDWRNTEHAHIDDHSQAYTPHMDKENGTLISLNVEGSKQ